jgi:hypothetical protein
VVRLGGRRVACRILERRPEWRRPLGRPRRRWKDNIKWIFKKWDGAWTGLTCFRIGTCGGFCKGGNEPSGSIKCGECLD